MPGQNLSITIDGREIRVPEGITVLDAARRLGIDIPTLCYLKELPSSPGTVLPSPCQSTSCLVCLVKYQGRMVPACATPVVDGMQIESETDEARALRKTSLELLLSNHLGDCIAPCQFGCPAKLDIPNMLRALGEQDSEAAIRIIKERIALPAVLGRICPKPCEKVCRRKDVDAPVSICQLKRYAADTDLGQSRPFSPAIAPPSGKRVAVLGAGPAGLSAAYYLCVSGHEVVLFDNREIPGGRLRHWDEESLPKDVLDAEIEQLLALPIETRFGTMFDWKEIDSLPGLLDYYDAVLWASGPLDEAEARQFGLPYSKSGLAVVPGTYHLPHASFKHLFAAGTIIRGPKAMVVRSVADGRESAEAIDRFLRTGEIKPIRTPYSVRIRKMNPDDLSELRPNGSTLDREEPEDAGTDDYEPAEAAEQASRCLHCDCRGRNDCQLLKYAELYEARTDRYQEGNSRSLIIQRSGDVLFEPGKCIQCGICITITKTVGEPLGLTWVGRGFDVKIDVPFEGTFAEGLGRIAKECAQACPTAAIVSLEK